MKTVHYYCAITMLLTAACTGGSETPKPSSSVVRQQQDSSPEPTPIVDETEKSVTELIRAEPFLEKEKRSTLLRTWRLVPKHENYRTVRPSDFKIPDWVKRERYWPDVARSTGSPSDYGEMSGAYGLIAFIVDKTIVDNDRFSVVVFIERPGNRYTLHWILRNKDLSRVNLRRHSGNVYLQEFRDDGTSRSCDVQWDHKEKKWGCNLDVVSS